MLGALSFSLVIGVPIVVIGQDFIAGLLYLGLTPLSAHLVEALHDLVEKTLNLNRCFGRTNNEQTVAIREAAHRTQNDLQILAWTISRQAKSASDPAVRAALREAEARVQALSRMNRRLNVSGQDVPGEVEAADFLAGLLNDMRQAAVGLRPISIQVAAQPCPLSLARAVAIGVILNELVTNAPKYAFPDDQPGTVRGDFYHDDDSLVLAVTDDGVGWTAHPCRVEPDLASKSCVLSWLNCNTVHLGVLHPHFDGMLEDWRSWGGVLAALRLGFVSVITSIVG